jgi:hypothetical protein
MRQEGEHPEIAKARLAMEDVTAAIRAYEKEKARLEEESEKPGVKGLSAKHTLAQVCISLFYKYTQVWVVSMVLKG